MATPFTDEEPSLDETAPEPRKPNRKILLLLGAAVAAAGLAAAVVYGPTTLRLLQQKDVTLTTPAQISGLSLDTSAEAADTSDYLRTALAAGLQLDDSVGAVYTDPADPAHSVIVAAGAAMLRNPGTDLDRVFDTVTDPENGFGTISEVPAGPLGGVMKCGTSTGDEGALAICGWADHGSIAIAIFPGRTTADASELLRTMRGQIQHRD